MRRWHPLLLGIATVIAGIIGVLLVLALFAGQVGIIQAYPVPPEAAQDPAVANGARIYFTGTDTSGRVIPYQGGMPMPMTCANCHGPAGRGRQTMMFVSPNITYANLTNPEGMLEPDGQRMPPYNDTTLRRAITQGIDSMGEPLDWPMPRWQMSGTNLDDLIAFLKILK